MRAVAMQRLLGWDITPASPCADRRIVVLLHERVQVPDNAGACRRVHQHSGGTVLMFSTGEAMMTAVTMGVPRGCIQPSADD
jgi:hypothetical protein